MADGRARPWYRESWVWAVLAIPGAAVLMGIVMITLAVRSDDGLVADDYYKQGLAINQVIDRQERAKALGVAATVAFTPAHDGVRVALAGRVAPSASVRLLLVHPTRSGLDQVVELDPQPGGGLAGKLAPPSAGRWRLVLEDRAAGWRVSGVWHTDEATVALGGEQEDGRR